MSITIEEIGDVAFDCSISTTMHRIPQQTTIVRESKLRRQVKHCVFALPKNYRAYAGPCKSPAGVSLHGYGLFYPETQAISVNDGIVACGPSDHYRTYVVLFVPTIAMAPTTPAEDYSPAAPEAFAAEIENIYPGT